MPKKTKKQSQPLTGQALLTKVKTLNDLTREEKAKVCGYYKIAKSGTERINVMAFLNAVLDAEGMDLDAQGDRKKKHGGRNPTFRISVQSNGNLLVGSAYTKRMELQPGDEFEIALGRKHIHLKLKTEED
ncbi:AbrB family transcriptional regulator (plasmid) [Acaryochloris sp. 'Moss Beach']|uniref:AbrB family transcriptional regulator n=1 Tax=Acaryochloris sp. 'Moss Beach' TaxID=2740837 RepID=UPI001F487FC1|nr:AbrB family transcriptional regulator [Acaryochloris sp. 'Moss Beach']UJB72893.1 AbrB family transcriptional regulator [Acaryochloris sp. 'Moss Beach']